MGFRSLQLKREITSGGFTNTSGSNTNSGARVAATADSRKHPRYPVTAIVKLSIKDQQLIFKTHDISNGGFSIKKNLLAEFAEQTFKFEISYENTDDVILKAEGYAKLLPGSLCRFALVKGDLSKLISKITGVV